MHHRLRSRSGQIMALIGIAFAGVGLIALATESLSLLWTNSWVYLWFAFLSWLLFWNPSVTVSDSGVLVDNIFHKIDVDWSAIRRIDTKYSLTLETRNLIVRAFAAPAPSRYAGFMASRTDAQHLPESSFIGQGLVRPGDLTTSDSGAAAFLIRRHWELLRDRGELNGEERVFRTLLWWRVIVFFALSIGAVMSFIF